MNALRSDGQVVSSSFAAALTLPSCSASWKARSASARSARNRLGCQPTGPLPRAWVVRHAGRVPEPDRRPNQQAAPITQAAQYQQHPQEGRREVQFPARQDGVQEPGHDGATKPPARQVARRRSFRLPSRRRPIRSVPGQGDAYSGYRDGAVPTGSRHKQRGDPECGPCNRVYGPQTPGVQPVPAPQQSVISPAKKIRPDRCGAATLSLWPQKHQSRRISRATDWGAVGRSVQRAASLAGVVRDRVDI